MEEKQKSVFIRFNMADEADSGLYLKLVEAAGSSASLTAYVKRALEEHFSVKMEMTGRQEFYRQMVSAVREEMQAQGMKLVGALLAGIGTVNFSAKQEETVPVETELPEVCRELPEELSGILDLISLRVKWIGAWRYGERVGNTAYAPTAVTCCRYDSRCRRCVADSGNLRDIEMHMLHICNQI